MSRILVIAVFVCMLVAATECRRGWKTYGNGYLIYTSKTNFSTTNKFDIHGIFSVMPTATSKHTLLSVYDANDLFAFQIMIGPGRFYTAYNVGSSTEEKIWNAFGVNNGLAYASNITVSKQYSASGSLHTIVTDIPSVSGARFMVTLPNATFNFSSIKIKVGGNAPDPVGAAFFEGCLSNFTFQGVDIIRRYFTEYPTNTNPVRGAPTRVKNGHSFSNTTEPCDDVLATTKPTDSGGPSTTVPWSSTLPGNSSGTTVSPTRMNNDTVSPSGKSEISPTSPSNDANSVQTFVLTVIFSACLTHIIK